MNLRDATNILTDTAYNSQEAFDILEYNMPAGVCIEEVLEQVIYYADSEDLDTISKLHFGLIRTGGTFMVGSNMGASDPESDECFRARLLDHIGKASKKSTAHIHSWKHYEGFTQVYDYCTGCDEKKL